MNVLLDIHSVLWFFEDDEKLSKSAIEVICNNENNKFVSIATIWETAIKYSIGKLKLDGGIDGFIESIDDNGFLLLEISPEHTKAVTQLPFIHRDPFDRMLIAQAIIEDMTIMTVDENVIKYEINSIW